MAAETRIAATLAHALRQPEHGGGQPLLMRLQRRLHQMPAVQRHRPGVATVFGHRQQDRRDIQPGEGGTLLRHHLQKETEYAMIFGHGRFRRRGQQPPPCERQGFVIAGWRRVGVLFLVRLLHAHAIRGDNQNDELSRPCRGCSPVSEHRDELRLTPSMDGSWTVHHDSTGVEQTLRIFRLLFACHQRPEPVDGGDFTVQDSAHAGADR